MPPLYILVASREATVTLVGITYKIAVIPPHMYMESFEIFKPGVYC